MVSGIVEYNGSHTILKLNALHADARDISNDIKFYAILIGLAMRLNVFIVSI
ncbi:MAG TPA: hypothetical protein PK906_17950 [Spirochaetota bacterium]|nr:hypothetical protein [Spirochaetota bacterium]